MLSPARKSVTERNGLIFKSPSHTKQKDKHENVNTKKYKTDQDVAIITRYDGSRIPENVVRNLTNVEWCVGKFQSHGDLYVAKNQKNIIGWMTIKKNGSTVEIFTYVNNLFSKRKSMYKIFIEKAQTMYGKNNKLIFTLQSETLHLIPFLNSKGFTFNGFDETNETDIIIHTAKHSSSGISTMITDLRAITKYRGLFTMELVARDYIIEYDFLQIPSNVLSEIRKNKLYTDQLDELDDLSAEFASDPNRFVVSISDKKIDGWMILYKKNDNEFVVEMNTAYVSIDIYNKFTSVIEEILKIGEFASISIHYIDTIPVLYESGFRFIPIDGLGRGINISRGWQDDRIEDVVLNMKKSVKKSIAEIIEITGDKYMKMVFVNKY